MFAEPSGELLARKSFASASPAGESSRFQRVHAAGILAPASDPPCLAALNAFLCNACGRWTLADDLFMGEQPVRSGLHPEPCILPGTAYTNSTCLTCCELCAAWSRWR